jgi:hypothetical protein
MWRLMLAVCGAVGVAVVVLLVKLDWFHRDSRDYAPFEP